MAIDPCTGTGANQAPTVVVIARDASGPRGSWSGALAPGSNRWGTDSEHLLGYHPNLLKQLSEPEHRDPIWVADTTFLLSEEGWCYLATVMDWCQRGIVGWSVSQRNDAELGVHDLGKCRHHPQQRARRHRASQRPWQHLCLRSLLTRARSLQNAPEHQRQRPLLSRTCVTTMESFFGRYKTTAVRDWVLANEAKVRANAFDDFEVYYH